jgi:hypothetical protein
MNESLSYSDKETKQRCLESLKKTNHKLELYNLFLDDAIAQIETELRQQKRIRLSQRHQIIN